jgi:glyoxylase-like metal-dependent hydrolase (beta-lactamase superfamily II)
MRKLHIAVAAAVGAAALLASPAARADLQDVAKAMGTPQTLQYAGSGLSYGIGQAYKPGMPWPRMNLVSYSRTDDYAGAAQNYDYTLVRADQLGGTAVPQRGEFRRAGGVSGDHAWIVNYPAPDAVQAAAVPLQHDLWIAPHGIVHAALAGKATMDGPTFAIGQPGKFKAKATVDGQNLVTKVESWIDNAVLGDMAVVTTYSDYKDYGGIKFPGRVNQSMGGFTVLELTIADVKVNPGAVAAPAQIGAVPNDVKLEKAAEGVWFVSGGSHNSAIIEMRDYVILYEAPLGDGRTNAVIKATKEALPNKPIRYAVASHHHFDHSGGLRAAAAEGAIIVVPEMSKAYFEQAYANPRTLNPDSLAKSGKPVKFETYGDKHVISDGARTLELHLFKNNVHADGYVLGYLPKEKIIIQADSFSPRAPVTQTPSFINPATKNLWENIVALKLDVDTVLPLHGRMVKVDELKTEAGVR